MNSFLDENKITAGQIGAMETAVKAMYMHMNNANVCESACGALGNITTIGKQKIKCLFPTHAFYLFF